MRLGPTQTPYFSLSKSGDLPDHTCTERFLGDQRRVMTRDVLSDSFSVASVLTERCMRTHERILRYTKYRL